MYPLYAINRCHEKTKGEPDAKTKECLLPVSQNDPSLDKSTGEQMIEGKTSDLSDVVKSDKYSHEELGKIIPLLMFH